MIELRSLTKEFNGVPVLKGLDCRVESGEIYGFIGPNGAGKTTTMRILATLLEPTGGDALVNGHSVTKEPVAARKCVGFMPDFFGIYDGLSVEEFLLFFAGAFRIPRSRRAKTVGDVLALVDLGGKRDAPVETLSTGMRQRLCLAKTLLHDPMVLLLDEPAAGLDPRARIELRELLKALRSLGKTIFISSHILPELADFCNRFGILEGGKLIYSGSVDEAPRGPKTTRRITLRHLEDPMTVLAILGECSQVKELAGGKEAGRADHPEVRSVTFSFDGELEELADLVSTLVSRRVRLVGLEEEAVDLEDIFLSVTKGGLG